jgi:hypothetical protein
VGGQLEATVVAEGNRRVRGSVEVAAPSLVSTQLVWFAFRAVSHLQASLTPDKVKVIMGSWLSSRNCSYPLLPFTLTLFSIHTIVDPTFHLIAMATSTLSRILIVTLVSFLFLCQLIQGQIFNGSTVIATPARPRLYHHRYPP